MDETRCIVEFDRIDQPVAGHCSCNAQFGRDARRCSVYSADRRCSAWLLLLEETTMEKLMITFSAGFLGGVVATVIYYHLWSRAIARKLVMKLQEVESGRS